MIKKKPATLSTKLPRIIPTLTPQFDGVLFLMRHGQGVRESIFLATMLLNRN